MVRPATPAPSPVQVEIVVVLQVLLAGLLVVVQLQYLLEVLVALEEVT